MSGGESKLLSAARLSQGVVKAKAQKGREKRGLHGVFQAPRRLRDKAVRRVPRETAGAEAGVFEDEIHRCNGVGCVPALPKPFKPGFGPSTIPLPELSDDGVLYALGVGPCRS